MIYIFTAISVRNAGIFEVNGSITSLDETTARKELVMRGFNVLDIREATSTDLYLERLKKLRNTIQKGKSEDIVVIIEKPRGIFLKLLFWMIGE